MRGKKRLKWDSHIEVFEVNLSLTWTAAINPGKWNKKIDKSGFLCLAKGSPYSFPFLKHVQRFVFDLQPLDYMWSSCEEDRRSTWDEFETEEVNLYEASRNISMYLSEELCKSLPKGREKWTSGYLTYPIQCYNFLVYKAPRSVSQCSGEMTVIRCIHLQQRDPVFLGLGVQIQFKNWKLLAFYNSGLLGQSEECHCTVPNSSPQLLPTSVWEQHDYLGPGRRIWGTRILSLVMAQTWLSLLLQACHTG